jgi:hypothetical protein
MDMAKILFTDCEQVSNFKYFGEINCFECINVICDDPSNFGKNKNIKNSKDDGMFEVLLMMLLCVTCFSTSVYITTCLQIDELHGYKFFKLPLLAYILQS